MAFPKLPPAPKMSRKKSGDEMCKRCVYDPTVSGTWREQVENCPTDSCPMWQHRPVTVATINMNRKVKSNSTGSEIDIDSLIDDLEDDDTPTTERPAA